LKEVNPSKEHIPVINHGSTSILKLKPSISGWRLYSLICNKKKNSIFSFALISEIIENQ
jgi:hypothetical protein